MTDADGKVEYDGRYISSSDALKGFWKNDKRDGNGFGVESPNGFTYKGDWKNDEFHGKGSYKTSSFQVHIFEM